MTSALDPINIGTLPGDGTGDVPRAGFTKIKSNDGIFLSAVGNRQTLPGTFGTTSATGSVTVINDSTQAWATNQFAGQTLTLVTSALAGYSKPIASNTATSITTSAAFLSVVGSGVGYIVSPGVVNAGSDGFATTAGGTAPSTVVDANQAWTTNQWAGQNVTLLAGLFAGQHIQIASNTATALTLVPALASAIVAGTPYVIGPAAAVSVPQTAAEVTASIAPANMLYGENDVRRYGISVGTGSDDTAAINNTLAVAAINGRPALFAGLTLKSSGSHSHDISKCGADGQGAIINFTTMGSGATAWTLTSSVGGIYAYKARNVMTRLVLAGTGVGKGLVINTASGVNFLDSLQFAHGACINFATDLEIGSNSYILDFYGWSLDQATTATLSLPTGQTNSAEKVTFHGGFIGNSATGISHLNANTEVYCFGTSIDDCTTASVFQQNGSRVYLHGCHVELTNASTLTTSPFQIESANCLLSITGGEILCDGTAPFGFPSIFDIASGATVMTGGGLTLVNCNNTVGVLCTGAGRYIANAPLFQNALSGNPILIGTAANFNLLQDGGFEQSSIVDNIAITYDSGGTITSRTTSTSFTSIGVSTAQHHSGAQSLAAVKGAGGAAFSIFLPCQPGQRFGYSGYLYVSTTLTGNIFINGNFASAVVYGLNGIPLVIGGSGLAANTITNPATGAWIPFTLGGSGYVTPNWATVFYLQFNIGTGSATYFIDDVAISPM